MRNKAKKTVLEAVRDKVDEGLTELGNCSNDMLRLHRAVDIDNNEVEGGRCLRGGDGTLCFHERVGGRM